MVLATAGLHMAFYLWCQVAKQFISASKAIISAPFVLLLAFLNLQGYGLAFTLRYKLQDIRALVLKHASVFQRCEWGSNSRIARETSITTSRKCLHYATLFENPSLCLAPWVSNSVPWKTSRCALFAPCMSRQYCPRIFGKHLGDKYTVYLVCVIIIAFG